MDFLLPFLQSAASLITAAASLVAALISVIKAWQEFSSSQVQSASTKRKRTTSFSLYGTAALVFFVLSTALFSGWYLNYNKSYDELILLGDAAADESVGRYSEAINYYNRAIEINPQSGVVYAKLALAQMKSSEDKEIYVNNCDNAISRAGTDDFVLFNCGIVYITVEQYGKAIELYNKFLVFFPMERNAYYYRARAYRLSGEFDLAKIDYELCMKLSEDHNDRDAFYYNSCRRELASIIN